MCPIASLSLCNNFSSKNLRQQLVKLRTDIKNNTLSKIRFLVTHKPLYVTIHLIASVCWADN